LKNAGEVCSESAWISTPSSSRVLSKVLRAARAYTVTWLINRVTPSAPSG
jgi:hypothetical protein